MNVVCIYGTNESDSACKMLDGTTTKVIEMQGGHHFGGSYEKLAAIIMAQSRR